MNESYPILIAGPTASGKSGLALALAERLRGTIINADSMQVYRELRILTARPSADDEGRAPHALYGFVSGVEAYSAGRFVADAKLAIEAARAAGRVPILVGGTGLYFKALLDGLSPIPPIPADVRSRWRDAVDKEGAAALHARLAARDPETAARLAPNDSQRLVRALEVLDATGRSLADWQRETDEPALTVGETVGFVVSPEREALYARCDARFEAMMASGALEEVHSLAALGFDPSLPIMRSLGMRPLLDHLAGLLSREDAVTAAKAETRRYAKRQMTWSRGQMTDWTWLSADNPAASLANALAVIEAQLTPASPAG